MLFHFFLTLKNDFLWFDKCMFRHIFSVLWRAELLFDANKQLLYISLNSTNPITHFQLRFLNGFHSLHFSSLSAVLRSQAIICKWNSLHTYILRINNFIIILSFIYMSLTRIPLYCFALYIIVFTVFSLCP